MAAPQEESFSLPPPELIAGEIIEDLRAALEQLEEIAADLPSNSGERVSPS